MRCSMRDYLDSIRDKRIAVIGIGVSNRPLIELLLKNGISVTACDRATRDRFDAGVVEELERLGAQVRLGESYLDDLLGFDIIFRTPGMRPDTPPLERARAAGAEITSEMEVFFQVCPATTIAVTGSDGKTTTTTILSGLLRAAGYRTFVGGNIGRPLLADVEDMTEQDFAVLELSSFQLMTMHDSPHIAVVTNLAPNHLDVHTSMEEYTAAKQNIYRYQTAGDRVILNWDNAITRSFSADARGEVTFFSRLSERKRGTWLAQDGTLRCNGRAVLSVEDILLPGVHNIENYLAALAAVDGLVEDAVIRDFARSFGGVEHRIELVRELNGVRYYNDSIASSPTRTIAGLRSFPERVILIAGGYDKNLSYDELGTEISDRVKVLVLTGTTAEKIKTATLSAPNYDASGGPEILTAEDFRDAVLLAHRMARSGDVVLLSPASASFDQFKNFAQRGEAFKAIVKEL